METENMYEFIKQRNIDGYKETYRKYLDHRRSKMETLTLLCGMDKSEVE